jgi:hypothetical protein
MVDLCGSIVSKHPERGKRAVILFWLVILNEVKNLFECSFFRSTQI